jgi:hypothetical protein
MSVPLFGQEHVDRYCETDGRKATTGLVTSLRRVNPFACPRQ